MAWRAPPLAGTAVSCCMAGAIMPVGNRRPLVGGHDRCIYNFLGWHAEEQLAGSAPTPFRIVPSHEQAAER